MPKLIINTDGGSRNNPGDAAIGVVLHLPGGVKGYSEAIGKATNNVAEYRAVIFGLKKAKQLLGGEKARLTEVEIRSDSELVVSQLRGEFQIKEESLKLLFVDVWNLKQEFKSVDFEYIPREENAEADSLVNRALDTLL
jgi:ribonuclease HI